MSNRPNKSDGARKAGECFSAKKVAVLFSGAKDSTFAIYKAINMGLNVRYLITMIPERDDSYMFHHPNIGWTSLQAEALGIEIIKKRTPAIKEEELQDLKKVLESIKDDVDGVVSGAIESRYQRVRIDNICRELGLESHSPHWQRSMRDYLEEIVNTGFEVIITAVAAEGLDKEWLGRIMDRDAIKELDEISRKYGIHKGGEGGEYESMVLDGPIFKKRIEIVKARKEWDSVRGIYVIEDAKLVEK